jgi:hypothetical protein
MLSEDSTLALNERERQDIAFFRQSPTLVDDFNIYLCDV